MRKIKQFFQHRKGSGMILAMIVLVNAMLIIVSISLISIAERKMSSKFKTSTPAFQMADSGVEAAIKRIQDNDPSDKIRDAFGNDNQGRFACPNVPDCELMFYSKTDPANPLDRNDDMGDIYTVRAIGSNGSGQEISSRAIELTMAQSGGGGVTGGCTLNSNSVYQRWGAGCKSGGAVSCMAAEDTGYDCGFSGIFGGTNMGLDPGAFWFCLCVAE